jgi:hypothetical protein
MIKTELYLVIRTISYGKKVYMVKVKDLELFEMVIPRKKDLKQYDDKYIENNYYYKLVEKNGFTRYFDAMLKSFIIERVKE